MTETAATETPTTAPIAQEAPKADAPIPGKPAATAEKPAAASPAVAKPAEAPVEKTFNSDVLFQCTARFTRRAWDLVLRFKKQPELFETQQVRASLTARTLDGAQELARILKEEGQVREYTPRQKTLELTTTLALIQLVIKHPQMAECDAVPV